MPKSDLRFDPVGLENIECIMPVMQQAFPAEFGEAWTASQVAALLLLPGSALLAVEADQQIVGFALTRCVLDECELLLLAVSPSMQRRGIGNALLHETKHMAVSRGIRKLMLEVRASNAQALALYARAGLLQKGRRPNYYRGSDGSLHDALTMAVEIDR